MFLGGEIVILSNEELNTKFSNKNGKKRSEKHVHFEVCAKIESGFVTFC